VDGRAGAGGETKDNKDSKDGKDTGEASPPMSLVSLCRLYPPLPVEGGAMGEGPGVRGSGGRFPLSRAGVSAVGRGGQGVRVPGGEGHHDRYAGGSG